MSINQIIIVTTNKTELFLYLFVHVKPFQNNNKEKEGLHLIGSDLQGVFVVISIKENDKIRKKGLFKIFNFMPNNH